MRAGIVTATPENKRSPRSPRLRSELESGVERRAVGLPLGVQVLVGANSAALTVAHACSASVVRVKGFVFAHAALTRHNRGVPRVPFGPRRITEAAGRLLDTDARSGRDTDMSTAGHGRSSRNRRYLVP
jgi:hypothetical protein